MSRGAADEREPSDDLETDPSLRMLANDDGREMLAGLDEPMTALELADECEIPRSTGYRKIEMLHRAGLVTEGVRVQPSGGHPATYQRDVADVHRCLEREGFGIELYGPDADAGRDWRSIGFPSVRRHGDSSGQSWPSRVCNSNDPAPFSPSDTRPELSYSWWPRKTVGEQ